MNKLKSIFVLALTLCCLTAGAMLPVMVGAIQNQTAAEPGFGEIRSVDLRLEEPLSLMEKLSVLAMGQYYPISKDTVLTKEELLEHVESGLGPYYYRELVPYNWKDVSIQTAPYIAYREDAPEQNYAVWFVALESSDWKAEIMVDDETGTILALQFVCFTEQNTHTTSSYAREVKSAWFESVGFDEADWKEKDLGVDGNTRTLRCYSTGQDSVGITMEFLTFPSGFTLFVLES